METSPATDTCGDSENEEIESRKSTAFCDRCVDMCSTMERCFAYKQADRLAAVEDPKQASPSAYPSYPTVEYQTSDVLNLNSSIEELRNSGCGVCRLIGLAVYERETVRTRKTESLIFEWHLYEEGFEFYYSYEGFLGFAQSLSRLKSFPGPDRGPSVQTFPSKCDLGLVEGWVQDCEDSHPCCTPEKQRSLRDLRVIDCHQRSIIRAPEGCHYVALSYVWGKHRSLPLQEESYLPAGIPATIEDGITATRLLGYQYLWVDQYCVQQQDSRDKKIQVQQMDLIYASAQITLIGAAGEDCTYGLPGVGRNRNFAGLSVDVGFTTLRLELDDHSVTSRIELSVWFTRAWTFQEGYLSRRRLYFTDYEILFVCNKSTEKEFNFGGFKPNLRNLEYTFPTPNQETASPLSKATGLLRKYSDRTLSFQSDALNAVLGILRSLRNEPDPVGSIWGLPFGNAAAAGETPDYRLCLYWYNSAGCRTRRHGFPSWSPLAWEGGKSFDECQHPVSATSMRVLWEQCDRQYSNEQATGLMNELFLTAYIVRLLVERSGGTSYALLPTLDDTKAMIGWDDHEDYDKAVDSVLCAINIYKNVSLAWYTVPFTVLHFIILEARGAKYERKGNTRLLFDPTERIVERWLEDQVKQTIVLI